MDPPPPARASRFALGLDFLSDLGVFSFAVWTLVAYVGMATQARVTLIVPIWLATVPMCAALLVALPRRARAVRSPTPPIPPDDRFLDARTRRYLVLAAAVGGLGSAVLAGAAATAPWALIWAGAFAAIGAALVLGRLRSPGQALVEASVSWPAHALAAVTGLLLAAMSLFINRPNGDDAFYVNRATGVAELNRIPTRDIIFTREQVDPVGGTGLPVDTFSALQGAVGRVVGLHGASVAYYLAPPIFTFLATWALWRLLRAWAPRNLLLCFALGCVYLLYSAQSGLTPGSFFLNRMWQGKVVFVAWLVPTTYLFLTRWLGRRDAATAVLLVAAGVGSIGLTSSAAFVSPLLFAAAALPLVAAREWRGLPLVAAAGAAPFVIGFAATEKFPLVVKYQLVEKLEAVSRGPFPYLGSSWYFHEVFGVRVLAAVGLIALCAAPWLARSGAAARVATGAALVTIVLIAPAVLPALNSLTNLTTVLRRTLWIVPLPALVGLLAAVPVAWIWQRARWPSAIPRRVAGAAPAVVLAALLAAFGHPLWTSWRNERPLWESRPTWKVNEETLTKARAILRRYDGRGAILADEAVMHVIALTTAEPKAVNPRSFYARFLPEDRRRTVERLALTRFVEGEKPEPTQDEVKRALADLNVGLVCVDQLEPEIIGTVRSFGNYVEAFTVRGRVCLERRPPL